MSLVKKRIGLLLAVSLGLLSALAVAQSNNVTKQIESRLAPVGKVCMAGDDCAAAPVASASSGEPRSGEEIYGSACATCHDAGVSGAPVLGSADDWASRIEKGSETLYDHAINGFNAMPAMGLCSDCSDEEIQATVDYMVEESS
ncbi:cytochrome c5 family protein [Marinimicrobium sp. C6131]|uniref:c-type cytochrome n=1 Tax=Marinimicrobium sp. C6131 TaxID=3022676 RepID=UPI00223D8436|nr:cytochrome c5 family protein [Marinimicrobium sp. C6131]UZJ43802.1 cytochrome c5 family protein [Marinimicrobium sp. C6131]